MLQKEEQTVCVYKPEYWRKKKKLYSFILVIVTYFNLISVKAFGENIVGETIKSKKNLWKLFLFSLKIKSIKCEVIYRHNKMP